MPIGCPCKPLLPCPAGKYTKAVGFHSAQTQCEFCPAGKFKTQASPSYASIDYCTTQVKCPDGKYTKVASSDNTQTVCETCLCCLTAVKHPVLVRQTRSGALLVLLSQQSVTPLSLKLLQNAKSGAVGFRKNGRQKNASGRVNATGAPNAVRGECVS